MQTRLSHSLITRSLTQIKNPIPVGVTEFKRSFYPGLAAAALGAIGLKKMYGIFTGSEKAKEIYTKGYLQGQIDAQHGRNNAEEAFKQHEWDTAIKAGKFFLTSTRATLSDGLRRIMFGPKKEEETPSQRPKQP
jgi:hypothetical protein